MAEVTKGTIRDVINPVRELFAQYNDMDKTLPPVCLGCLNCGPMDDRITVPSGSRQVEVLKAWDEASQANTASSICSDFVPAR